MLLVDDIACFPFKSILMVFREIYNAAVQELEQEGDRLRLELSQLYLSLESGAIDEATFDNRERVLLDRLDELEARDAEEADEDDPDEADEGDPDEEDDEDEDDEDDDEPEAEAEWADEGEDAGNWGAIPDGDS